MSAATKPASNWQECERISNLPGVDEALRTFSHDSTGDNATGVVSAILAATAAPQVSPIPNDQGEIRRLFLKGLVYMRKNKFADFPEGIVTLNNQFQRFMNSDTDSAWIGFRLAMQAARTLATATLQPMDTAPLDGTEVILRVKSRAGMPHKYLVGHYMQGGHCIEDHPAIAAGWYFWNGCMFDSAADPEGWLALPADEARTA